jgi:hypothetical protein
MAGSPAADVESSLVGLGSGGLTSSLPDAVGVLDTVARLDETATSETVRAAAVDAEGTGPCAEAGLDEVVIRALLEPVALAGGRGVVLADRAGLADDDGETMRGDGP